MRTFEQFKADDAAFVANTYGRFPLALVEGKGAACRDEAGRQYIDLTSGIGVNSLGFCDEGWAAAVAAQAAKLQHTSNLYYTEPCIVAAKTLCARTGMKKVFFANSGAEANEGAIKAARKYSFEKYGEGRSKILTLVNSFHGRTVTTLAATGQDVFHNYFFPFTEGFAHLPANDPDALRAALDGTVCAVMVELVQGEGGVIPLDKDYVRTLAALCAERDVLLLVDEVQTGVGRTGTLYAFEQFGLAPDLVTSAKGLGGGLPVGAVLFGERTAHVLGAGDHATTFGGNPVVCAGVNYVLGRVDDALLADVRRKGKILRAALAEMPHIRSVSGLGLMLGVELEEGIPAKEVLLRAIKEGVLVLTAKARLRLLPPLTITDRELEAGIAALGRALASF